MDTKTDCLTPCCACVHGVITFTHEQILTGYYISLGVDRMGVKHAKQFPFR